MKNNEHRKSRKNRNYIRYGRDFMGQLAPGGGCVEHGNGSKAWTGRDAGGYVPHDGDADG